MRIKTQVISGAAAADADAFVTATAATADTPFTLEAGAAAISPPREVQITSDGDDTAVNFLIIGTDRYGNPQSEVIAGPDTGAVLSKGVYASITSITPDDDSANSLEVGFAARVVGPWVISNTNLGTDTVPAVSVQLSAASGVAFGAGSIERTFQNGNHTKEIGPDGNERFVGERMDVIDDSTTFDFTTEGDSFVVPCTYCRVVVTADAGGVKASFARPSF